MNDKIKRLDHSKKQTNKNLHSVCPDEVNTERWEIKDSDRNELWNHHRWAALRGCSQQELSYAVFKIVFRIPHHSSPIF